MVWDQELDPERARPYWPDFVEDDYRAVLGVVGRYALYTGVPHFTFGQLEGHLDRSNVELVGEADWPTLFAEMQRDIIRDLAAEGRSYEWQQRRVGHQVLYSLVSIGLLGERVLSGAEVALAELTRAEPQTDHPEVELAGEDERGDRRLDELFERHAGRRIRTKELPGLIMSRFRVDAIGAAEIIQAARSEGRLHKHAEGGISFLSLDPRAETTRRPRRVARHEDAERSVRPLNGAEVAAAEQIMDALTARGKDSGAGSTIRRLEQELSLGLSPVELRRLLRHMESMRLISIDNSGHYGQARKSPRVRIRDKDTKILWASDRAGYITSLRASKIVG